MLEAILPIAFLSPAYLAVVCEELGSTADEVGQLLAAVHGGILCFTDEIDAAS